MALIARNLIRRGEDVHQLMRRGRCRSGSKPIGSWDVRGGPREADWWYRVDEFGPSGNLTHFIPAASVLHCPLRRRLRAAVVWHRRRSAGRGRPARSRRISKLGLARKRARRSGHVIPVPSDGGDGSDDDDPLAAAEDRSSGRSRSGDPRRNYKRPLGAMAGNGGAASRLGSHKAIRGGTSPDSSVSPAHGRQHGRSLSACGGTGIPGHRCRRHERRAEAWRRFVMGINRTAAWPSSARSSRRKLETRVAFDLSALWAHDLSGRAASFKSMVTAGMSLERAAALSGLLGAEDT